MTIAEILQRLPGLSALVLGDICLDRWCTYDPALADPSRETGLPRIGVIRTQSTPGGGGTVANNAVALGLGRVSVAGVTGDDAFGWELRRELDRRGIGTEGLIAHPDVATFTYTKLINLETGAEDVPRVDFIRAEPMPADAELQLLDRITALCDGFDIVFVADQAETEFGGVITAAVRNVVSEYSRLHPRKIIWVDSRMRPELFRDVIIKINQDEARAASVRACDCTDYRRLKEHVRAPRLFITHGAEGALILTERGETWATARAVGNPVDICGAGDSFSAAAASALAAGANAVEAAQFGNLVASITIMKRGTGTASSAEVLQKCEKGAALEAIIT
jgi:rfaE bifunctional protein kinase chain/domain